MNSRLKMMIVFSLWAPYQKFLVAHFLASLCNSLPEPPAEKHAQFRFTSRNVGRRRRFLDVLDGEGLVKLGCLEVKCFHTQIDQS